MASLIPRRISSFSMLHAEKLASSPACNIEKAGNGPGDKARQHSHLGA